MFRVLSIMIGFLFEKKWIYTCYHINFVHVNGNKILFHCQIVEKREQREREWEYLKNKNLN